MPLYKNTHPGSQITAVEFIPRPDSNVAFFYVKSPDYVRHLKGHLAELNQEVLGESTVNGQQVLITRGTKTEEEIQKVLAVDGEKLVLPPEKKEFHPWKWRSNLSYLGQTLNLISGKVAGTGMNPQKMAFAGLNLTANWVNGRYGAQKAEDVHQLNYLKEHVNALIAPSLPKGAVLPAIDDSRAELRSEPPKHKSLGDKFDDFMKKNSVRFGEIGLRYMGSLVMLPDIKKLKALGGVNGKGDRFDYGKAWENLKTRSPKDGFGLLNNDKTLRYTAGLYLIGKSTGLLFAKTPDPYDPKPKTAFDTFREKYAFKISTVIETAAGAVLAIGSYNKKNAKGERDWFGAAGGATVTVALMTRFLAKFGVKQVDQKELRAHIVDSLAMVPDDKRAEVLAQTAAFLKEHFKDSPETYGQIFTALKDKLYHDRGLYLYPPPEQQPSREPEPEARQSAKIPAPKASFVERAAQQPQQAALGIS